MILWIRAYLSNRVQHVEVNGHCSIISEVPSGVPQGSVLGPVLFLIYINDIAAEISQGVTVRLFADDCVLYSKIREESDQHRLSTSVRSIQDWCSKWKMKINTEKTVFARITNRTKNVLSFTYKLNGSHLVEVDSFKYLGVTLSKDLSWSQHINEICHKALKKLWFLRRNLNGAPPHVKLMAYTTYIRPTLEYAASVWDPYRQNQICELEKVQRKAVRFILAKYNRHDSVTDMLNSLNLPLLSVRRKIARLKFFFMFCHHLYNINPDSRLTHRASRELRYASTDQFEVPKCNIDAYKFSFFPRTVNDWNNLPQNIFSLNRLDEFESALLNMCYFN